MDWGVQHLLELFADASRVYRRAFPLYDKYASMACATMSMYLDTICEPTSIKTCIKLVKRKTSITSPFRRGLMLPASVFLAGQDSPSDILQKTIDLTEAFKTVFQDNSFISVASLMLAAYPCNLSPDEIASLAYEYYTCTKQHNDTLAKGNFSSVCCVATLSGMSAEKYADCIERAYRALSSRFSRTRGIPTLAQALATSPEDLD